MRFNAIFNGNGTAIETYIFEYRNQEVHITPPDGMLSNEAIKNVLRERLDIMREKYSAMTSSIWPSERELTEMIALCFILTGGKIGWESSDDKIDQVISRINQRNRKLKLSSFFSNVALRLLHQPQNPACQVHHILQEKSLSEKQRQALILVHRYLSFSNARFLQIADMIDGELVLDQLLKVTTLPFQTSFRQSGVSTTDYNRNKTLLAKPLAWAAYVDLMFHQANWNARNKIEELKPSIDLVCALRFCKQSKAVRDYYSGIAPPEPPSTDETKKQQGAARQKAFRERRKAAK